MRARAGDKQIAALYADMVARIAEPTPRIDVVNAKPSRGVVLASRQAATYRYQVRDCLGRAVAHGEVRLTQDALEVTVPVSGLLSLERLQ